MKMTLKNIKLGSELTDRQFNDENIINQSEGGSKYNEGDEEDFIAYCR